MRIGLVYDLRDDYRTLGFSEEAVAEFDSPETIDALAGTLAELGCAVDRVGHGRAFAARLAAGERWDLVFSIAEGVAGRSREAQVPALCELFDQAYAFSDPLTMAATLDKAVAKRLVRDAGIATAPFAVLHTADAAADARIGFPAFVKPIAEGTGKGCEAASRVIDRAALAAAAGGLIARFRQPALAEAYLPGREFTVGIVGNGAEAAVIAVLEVLMHDARPEAIYSFEVKEHWERFLRYQLADDLEARLAGARALAAYHALGCRDAARLDFRSDGHGSPHFLEANPIAGLHPTHSDLPILTTLSGRSYAWLIAAILRGAAERQGLAHLLHANASAALAA
jgi:D-alanine-D-alanine ligase